jgi:hypothetical protein
MPLQIGHKWSYMIRSGMRSRVETLEVTLSIAVAGVKGWQLEGPMGISRLAWKNKTLYVDQVPGTCFSPPIPLLDMQHPKGTWHWKGFLTQGHKTIECTAEIEQIPEKYTLGMRQYPTLKTTLTMKMPQKNTELITWFVDNIGILCQKQYTNHRLDCSMEYMSGPR